MTRVGESKFSQKVTVVRKSVDPEQWSHVDINSKPGNFLIRAVNSPEDFEREFNSDTVPRPKSRNGICGGVSTIHVNGNNQEPSNDEALCNALRVYARNDKKIGYLLDRESLKSSGVRVVNNPHRFYRAKGLYSKSTNEYFDEAIVLNSIPKGHIKALTISDEHLENEETKIAIGKLAKKFNLPIVYIGAQYDVLEGKPKFGDIIKIYDCGAVKCISNPNKAKNTRQNHEKQSELLIKYQPLLNTRRMPQTIIPNSSLTMIKLRTQISP